MIYLTQQHIMTILWMLSESNCVVYNFNFSNLWHLVKHLLASRSGSIESPNSFGPYLLPLCITVRWQAFLLPLTVFFGTSNKHAIKIVAFASSSFTVLRLMTNVVHWQPLQI